MLWCSSLVGVYHGVPIPLSPRMAMMMRLPYIEEKLMIRSSMVAVLASACLVAATAAGAGSIAFVRPYSVQGDFVDDDGSVATDLSGLACTALPARHCLAVNDENQTAQFATLEDGRILP